MKSSSRKRYYTITEAAKGNRLALFGLFIVCTGVLTTVFAPYLVTHDPYEINIENRLQSPSLKHWLSTDFLGRDTYSRIEDRGEMRLQFEWTDGWRQSR